jgi:hypothetical protein
MIRQARGHTARACDVFIISVFLSCYAEPDPAVRQGVTVSFTPIRKVRLHGENLKSGIILHPKQSALLEKNIAEIV